MSKMCEQNKWIVVYKTEVYGYLIFHGDLPLLLVPSVLLLKNMNSTRMRLSPLLPSLPHMRPPQQATPLSITTAPLQLRATKPAVLVSQITKYQQTNQVSTSTPCIHKVKKIHILLFSLDKQNLTSSKL